jgi:hypothetical protein
MTITRRQIMVVRGYPKVHWLHIIQYMNLFLINPHITFFLVRLCHCLGIYDT